jgi:type IV secretion system protein VirD4
MMYILVIIIVVVLMASIWKKEIPEHNYTAEFGNCVDHLSIWNKGFAIGAKAFTKKLSVTNFFLAGPTGSGKSTVVTIPCAVKLSRGDSSIIFNDVSGELYLRTSQYLADKGYKVLRLDFSDAAHSETFNPLLQCHSISDIQKLCLIIIQNAIGETKGDPFWENSSIGLLSLFARFLVFHQPPELRTLQNLQRLIEKFAIDSESVDTLIVQTKDESLLNAYKGCIVLGDRTLQSIIATARTALHLFNDPEVCKTTATNSIDFALLRKERVAIYVCNPLKDLRYFKPLSALFFQSLFNFVLSRIPGKREKAIFFVLDEFASMKFPDIAVTVSNIRKYNAGMLLCLQDEMSLEAQYGQAQAHQIKTNCGIQCFLKGEPLHTAKELSQIMGKYSYEDEKGTTRSRELMTPDEIRRTDAALILVNNQAPLKYVPTPYYNSIWLWRLSYAKPYVIQPKETQAPPLIQF